MDAATLLRQPHLSLITRDGDSELRWIEQAIAQPVRVTGRAEIEDVLGRLTYVDTERAPKTVDLIGHSTPDRSLLVLGDWVIDGASPMVLSFFRGLADCDVLPRLGIHAIRLLGCETAVSEAGRSTLIALADILEIEAYGTTQMIGASHYDAAGFRDDMAHVLVSASDLRRAPRLELVKRGGEPYRRVLDIDTLPSSPLAAHPPYPRRIADLVSARAILQLVRRADGAQMPGLVAAPSCELALPSVKPGWYHRMQVLMDGAFVRVYPDGDDRPGVVFPVDDSKALREILAERLTG